MKNRCVLKNKMSTMKLLQHGKICEFKVILIRMWTFSDDFIFVDDDQVQHGNVAQVSLFFYFFELYFYSSRNDLGKNF